MAVRISYAHKLMSNLFLIKDYPANHFSLYGNIVRYKSTDLTKPQNFIRPSNAKLNELLFKYEDFVGLTEVKEAQNKVLWAEKKFMEEQELRREKQLQIQQLMINLKEIHVELDKTSRGEDRYLHLITQEHSIIKEEKKLTEEFKLHEKAERHYFAALSAAVRESHEKERARAERTKYWSVIGSVFGAIVGILGTSINNWFKMRKLHGMIQESSNPPLLQELVSQLSESLKTQYNQLHLFISELKSLLGASESQELMKVFNNNHDIPFHSDEILDVIRKQDEKLETEMKLIKDLIIAQKGLVNNEDGVIVYVHKDVENMLARTEQNMEWKMKISSLVSVVSIYTAFVLTLPILYQIFKGS